MDVNKIRTIIGMDFGDGESAASILKIRNKDGSFDEESKVERLYLDNGGATKKPTTVTVGENGQFISFGDYDSDSGSMIQHFKRAPGEWNNDVKDIHGKKITSKDCMSYFVKSFISRIRNIDENKKWFDGDMNSVALFVGCPSGKKWTEGGNREKYEAMIREVTGMKNVCVIPESTAAVFSALRINQKDQTKRINFSLDDGIAVYDFGSSTSDFTYMLLGKMLIELSWRLGAASIEANMWSRALADNEGITPWMGKTDNYIMALRKLKEQWFGDFPGDLNALKNTGTVDKGIVVVQADPQNPGKPKMKVNAYTGSQKMDTAVMDITMCSAYIEHCLSEAKVENVEESGTSIDPAPYNKLVEKFFSRGKELMDKHNVPYRTVIITGGASRMNLIRDNCQAVFGTKVKIINDPSPSYCVSDGLCQIASNLIRLDPVKQETKGKTDGIAKNVGSEFRTTLQDKLVDKIYHALVSVMRSIDGKIKVGEFNEIAKERVTQALNQQAVKNTIGGAYMAVEKLFASEVNGIKTSIVKQIYSDQSLKEAFGSFDGLGRLGNGSTLVTVGQTVNTAQMLPSITKIVTGLIAFVVGLVIVCILAIISGGILAPVGFIAWPLVESLLQKHPGFKIEPKKYADKLKADDIKKNLLADSEFQESINKIVEESFSDKDLKEKIDGYIDKLCEIISLQKFEETIHS